MAKKIEVEGYTVSVFVGTREASDYWGHAAVNPSQAQRSAEEIREAIKRHLSYEFRDVMDRVIDVEQQASAICEHCRSPWTEVSAAYNGGCCDADEKANPETQEAV